MYACDYPWWAAHIGELAGFAGERWSIDVCARDRFGVRWLAGIDRPGLAPIAGEPPYHLHTGCNSGYQALGLAALFGAARILLLGYDFGNAGALVHWHGSHPRGLGNGGHYPSWIAAMNRLAIDLEKSHIEVINCSRVSALTCFPRRAIQACL